MTKLIFSPAAVADLEEIHSYIAKDSLSEAFKFIEQLKNRCEKLSDFPGTGTKRDVLLPGLRSVAEGNYLIFYRGTTDGIEIVRVIEAHRDFRKLFLVK